MSKDDTKELKVMSENDIEEIFYLEKQLFEDPWSMSILTNCLTYSTYFCLVAREENQIIGYLISQIVCGEGEIHRIGVLPSYRRRGIANCLMEEFINQNCETYLLEVRPSNEGAVSLYKRWGFEVIDTRKNYYHNPLEDAWIMCKHS
ncbi:Ribosomal-protein-S18p-alanine acetyltransferase [Lachnospiraceae bacterium TWA4]|nr:Ribosomal-protein-S18p-alanine acetyltransferase [Lachnospiraceae bacterium TWA4]